MRKENKKKERTKHHIISQCKRHKFNVHSPKNIIRLRDSRHVAFHQLFWTHEPQHQLEEFYDIIKTVLSDEADKLFNELLELDNFYDEEL